MVSVTSGKDWLGNDCTFYMDQNLHDNLLPVKKVVGKGGKNMDIVIIISGNCGIGKSTFAMSLCKFLDPTFNLKDISFRAGDFLEDTSNCENHKAKMLDETFASMNSRIGSSKEFLRIVNHLQKVRQKNLFIVLVLPNYFDLNKSIALYRSSFLFTCYGTEFGDRGRFAAFDREKKKMLFILGQKYLNYNAVQPNFRGRFYKQKCIDEAAYDKLKLANLEEKEYESETATSKENCRNLFAAYLRYVKEVPTKEIAKIGQISKSCAQNYINASKEEILEKYGEDKQNGKN